METLGELIWTILTVFVFFALIMVLFYIFSDLFRDHTMSGWGKAVWIFFLIILTPITCLVYLIARGKGMQERAMAAAVEMKQAQDSYIQQVAGTDPAEQIAKAKQLLDQGVIDDSEYQVLKSKALGANA